jgi:hypothetical protein
VTTLGPRTVVGKLSGMEARNGGWIRYRISEEGKQYPASADTKKPEIQAQCTALMGQIVKVNINSQDSGNPNPNRPGENFVNHYLEAIALAQAGDVSTAAPQTAPTQTETSPATGTNPQAHAPQSNVSQSEQLRQMRIMRQAAAKNVAAIYEFLPADQRTAVELVRACEVWMAYFVYGPHRFGVTPFNAEPQAQPAQQPAAPPPVDPPAQPMTHDHEQAPHPADYMESSPAPETEQFIPQGTAPPMWSCSECGTTDDSRHEPGCSSDIPF